MKASLSTTSDNFSLRAIYVDFREITKARLAVSVVFSSIAGYLLGFDTDHPFSWTVLVLLAIGGYCMVGASNAFNQIIEKDLDSLMDRTKNRPIPAGRMSVNTAFAVAASLTIAGLAILYNINPKTAMFGAVSILQLHVQGFGLGIPSQLLSSLPYLATIIALVAISALKRGQGAPASLGMPFVPDR